MTAEHTVGRPPEGRRRPGATSCRCAEGAHRHDPEGGSAIIEFQFLAVLLMVPLVYLVLAVFSVQAATFGLTQATREAGRVFVASGDAAAAEHAAALAMADQGIDRDDVDLRLTCSASPCFSAGAEVVVTASTAVPLPFLPDVLAGAVNAAIPVDARHVAVVDRYRQT